MTMTSPQPTGGPYAQAADAYWRNGWRGILPLPEHKKTFPPKGFTGRNGVDPSYPDIATWADVHPAGNIALRMPHNVVGLDIDAYGDKRGDDTITIHEAMYGPLPPTWRSSSRSDTTSGIRFYRVPEGLAWPGELDGGGVEIIQRVHRYAVVAPSIHPEGGSYRWRTPDGHPSTAIPNPAELPELPEAWVQGITGGRAADESVRVAVGDQEALGWVAGRPGSTDTACPQMATVIDTFHASTGSMHKALNDAVMTCIRYAEGQHPGAVNTLATIRQAFRAVVCAPTYEHPRTPGEADAEWMRSVVGAVGICLGDPGPRTCDCYGQMTADIISGATDSATPSTTETAEAQPAEPTLNNPLAERFTPGDRFVLDQPDDVPAVWGDGDQVLWAEGEALMIAAPPGVGKTTIAGQVVRGRMFGGKVLGLTVTPSRRKILYLAMDRPRQIARSLRRHFTSTERAALADKLVVWSGPLPRDLAKTPALLSALAELADADTVVVDSLKDAVIGLTDDEKAAAYNLSRQTCLAAGVEVLELHHMVKRGADGKPPTTLADVYGSMHLTSGIGSAIVLWGQGGDILVDLHHLKQPADTVGPLHLVHDHDAGLTAVQEGTDLLSVVAYAGAGGVTAVEAAEALFQKTGPTKNEKEKARRQLEKLVRAGVLETFESLERGDRGKPAIVWRVSHSEGTNEGTQPFPDEQGTSEPQRYEPRSERRYAEGTQGTEAEGTEAPLPLEKEGGATSRTAPAADQAWNPWEGERLAPAWRTAVKQLNTRTWIGWSDLLEEMLGASDIQRSSADNLLRSAVQHGVAERTGEYNQRYRKDHRRIRGTGVDHPALHTPVDALDKTSCASCGKPVLTGFAEQADGHCMSCARTLGIHIGGRP